MLPRTRGPRAAVRLAAVAASLLALTALMVLSGCGTASDAPGPSRGNIFESRPRMLTAADGKPRFVAEVPQAQGRGQVERGGGGAAAPTDSEPGGATVASAVAPERNLFVARCQEAEKVAIKQGYEQWCWAACTAMVLKYEGVDPNPDQMNIAGRFGPTGADQAVGPATLMRAMNPDLAEQLPKSFFGISPTHQTSTKLVEQILQGHPVIMGVRKSPDDFEGHLLLAYEVIFREMERPKFLGMEQDGPPIYAIEKVKLIDPQKDAPVELTGAELKQTTDFLISRPMARQVLEEKIRAHQEAAARSQQNSGNNTDLFKKWFD